METTAPTLAYQLCALDRAARANARSRAEMEYFGHKVEARICKSALHENRSTYWMLDGKRIAYSALKDRLS